MIQVDLKFVLILLARALEVCARIKITNGDMLRKH